MFVKKLQIIAMVALLLAGGLIAGVLVPRARGVQGQAAEASADPVPVPVASERPLAEEFPVQTGFAGYVSYDQRLDALPVVTIGAQPSTEQWVGVGFGIHEDLEMAWAQEPGCDLRHEPFAAQRPGSHADVPTAVVLVSPWFSDEDWRPTSLTREGTRFTLAVDACSNPVPRSATPPPKRIVHVLSLGQLPEGTYQFSLDIAWRRAGQPGFSTLFQRQSGAMTFHVDPQGSQIEHLAEALTEKNLVTTPEQAKPGQRLWQQPRCLVRAFSTEPDNFEANATRLPLSRSFGVAAAGRIDLAAWLKGSNEPVCYPPTISSLGSTDPMAAAIVGSLLKWGEMATVRRVEYGLGIWTIAVDVWRDDGARLKNVPHRDLLVVPLQLPPQGLARRVELTWRFMRAAEPGGPYHEEAASADFAASVLAFDLPQ